MPRWSLNEQRHIAEVRESLKEALASCPQYPEVVGDRKILRFLRGHGNNVAVAVQFYGNFLKWRKENNVDAMRENIINGMDHPVLFPFGDVILGLIPSLVISHDSFDRTGSPICVDQYKFKPAEVLEKIGLERYLTWTTYCLEYRSMVIEQLSEKAERDFLEGLSPEELKAEKDPMGDRPPHGVIKGTLVIRDISGVGLDHCSDKGREIIKAIIKVGGDNYPELLRKCYLVRCPWLFNALWFFIKGLLPHTTLAKISINGHNFQASLEEDLAPELVPSLIGGPYNGHMEPGNPFVWNWAFMRDGLTIDAEEANAKATWRRDNKMPMREVPSLQKVPNGSAFQGQRHNYGSVGSGNGSSHVSSRGGGNGASHGTGAAAAQPAPWTGAVQQSFWLLVARLQAACIECPLWYAALVLYALHFYATEQWMSLLPFTLPVLATWGVLIIL